MVFFFFFNDTASTEIYTLSLHDALPISYKVVVKQQEQEYYNVYLPGFVNGYPVLGGASETKIGRAHV